MGMYTELYLSVTLKGEIPENNVRILDYLSSKQFDPKFEPNDDHQFFKCARWNHIGNQGSNYFNPLFVMEFKKSSFLNEYYLVLRCDLKNYNNEIQHFLNWLKPWIDNYEHIGHFRYEEDEQPTLIYFENDNYVFR